MHHRLFLLFFVATLGISNVNAQQTDTVRHIQHPWIHATIAPAALTAGSLILLDPNGGGHTIIHNIDGFNTPVDDYMQFVPLLSVYALNLSGVKGKHRLGEASWLMLKSELLMAALVFPIKNLTGVPRPNGTNNNSYPSGHTAQAFLAATFLHKEYGDKSIWYSIGGYSIASATGVLRILKNRHRLTDVLLGAGIGILSTNVVYLTHKPWKGKHLLSQVHLMPTFERKAVGFNLIWSP